MQADSPTSARAAASYAATPAPIDHAGSHAHHGAMFDAAPSTATSWGAPVASTGGGTGFVTGAYQPSGDPMIDRMIRLEHALKRYGAVR